MSHYLSILFEDLSDRRRGSYSSAERPTEYLFGGVHIVDRAGGDLDSRYSQKGVQWAVKEAAKRAGIIKDVHVHTLRHTCATHLLEDGMDIISVKNFLGHENIETTIRTADAAISSCGAVANQTRF
jgi:site-specific recombinase XerD